MNGGDYFAIDAHWQRRCETPERLASRFRRYLELARPAIPADLGWYLFEGKSDSDSLARTSGQALREAIARGANVDDDGITHHYLGYKLSAYLGRSNPHSNTEKGSLIDMAAGASGFQNHFIFYTDLTLTDQTDPRLITFDVMKAHMMAIVWAFQPEWCHAGPGRLHDYLDRDVYVRPPMGLGWMTWIEGSLAKQIEVPRRNWNLELEAYSDGSLFMATGKETFSIENPTHLRQARAIHRQIDHLNYTSPFEGMSGRSDRVPPFPKV